LAYDIPEAHDPADIEAAQELLNTDGIPLGLVYRDSNRKTFDQKIQETIGIKDMKSIKSVLDGFTI